MADYFNLLRTLAEEIDDNKTYSIDEFEPDVPKEIRRFLGKLSMLQQVPYHYLVPDGRLVAYKTEETPRPDGSIQTSQWGALRFFWLDPEWVQALLSGALSIGEAGNAAYLLRKAMTGSYAAEAFSEETARRLKKQLGNAHTPEELETAILNRMQMKGIQTDMLGANSSSNGSRMNWRYTGFLLRSSLVSNTKGLEVTAMGRDEADSTGAPRAIPVIRMEKISGDTLFCLCEGVLTEVVIKQPSENLYFSVNGNAGNYFKQVKKEGGTIDMPIHFREGGRRVLNISQGTTGLADQLASITGEHITSAQVAKHMLSKPIKYTIGIEWDKSI